MSSVQTNIFLFTSGIFFATISFVGYRAFSRYLENRLTQKADKIFTNNFSYLFISDTLH